MAKRVAAMVGFKDRGAKVFDYGNSIRDEARKAGYDRAFDFPGFVPAYIRPQFEEGLGPFRWAALSGLPKDIAATDRAILELFPDNKHLRRWIEMAGEKVEFQGLPARICWLGYGERHLAGLKFNEMVASGELSAPIVIGRDHLDSGSVASPYRETEAMLDGSDAIADWPLLNALVNTSSGATWVSIHHGGGVGMGRSIHAGQVTVADGTELAAQKLARVLTNDPGMGVIRHVDAGYEHATKIAAERGVVPRVPVAVVAFSDEEGARFGVACIGSQLSTGALSAEKARGLRDYDGVTLAEAMTKAGRTPEHLGADPRLADRVGVFVELHVEQGRALDLVDRPIAVASAIWPHGRWQFTFCGEANHAGTTRLAGRHY